MTNIVTIGAVTTKVITCKGQRVCATQQLAQLYGTDDASNQRNHAHNTTRFEEGKHFIKATGEHLKSLRLSLSELQISGKARSLILWTERGAARHAKMLETDQAWDVFELQSILVEISARIFSTSYLRTRLFFSLPVSSKQPSSHQASAL